MSGFPLFILMSDIHGLYIASRNILLYTELSETVVQRSSVKNKFFIIFQYSQEKIFGVLESFLMKLQIVTQ